MARAASDLTPTELVFLAERHLGTLTTIRADGSPHVVPVGFTYDVAIGTVRVICSDGTQKVRNVEANGHAVVCQTDRANWLSLAGRAVVARSADAVAEGELRYGARYQAPRPNDRRVVLEIAVTHILGRVREAGPDGERDRQRERQRERPRERPRD